MFKKKTLYNLHKFIDAKHKKKDLSRLCLKITLAGTQMLCLKHVCNLILADFVGKSGFRSCFWSAQCNERQARTFDQVKACVCCSLTVQWRRLIFNVLYCNFLRSIEGAFLELEETMFNVTIRVPMFIIITPGLFARSKQSETFVANCNLKVNCE